MSTVALILDIYLCVCAMKLNLAITDSFKGTTSVRKERKKTKQAALLKMKSVNSNMINHMINDETLSLTRGSLFRFQGLSKIKNAITMWRWGLITPRFKDKAQQWHILQAGRGFIRSVPPRFYIVVGNVYMCKCVFVSACVYLHGEYPTHRLWRII